MAEIVVTTRINEAIVNSFIDRVYQACKLDKNLSPRSRRELLEHYRRDHFIIALDRETPVGWLIKVPLGKSTHEIWAVYVVAGQRLRGIFKVMLTKSLNYSELIIFVTFVPWLADHLQNTWGFERTSLWGVVKLTKGRFLLPRLNSSRIIAIFKHLKRNPAIYLIRKNDI